MNMSSTIKPKPHSHITIERTEDLPEEAALWRAVIAQAVRDMYDSTPSGPRLRREVLVWIHTRDFNTVCDNASVPAFDLKEQFIALSGMPLSLARKYGMILREKLNEDD